MSAAMRAFKRNESPIVPAEAGIHTAVEQFLQTL